MTVMSLPCCRSTRLLLIGKSFGELTLVLHPM